MPCLILKVINYLILTIMYENSIFLTLLDLEKPRHRKHDILILKSSKIFLLMLTHYSYCFLQIQSSLKYLFSSMTYISTILEKNTLYCNPGPGHDTKIQNPNPSSQVMLTMSSLSIAPISPLPPVAFCKLLTIDKEHF